MKKNALVLVLASTFASAGGCGGSRDDGMSSPDAGPGGPVNLTGVIQKGPFIVGSDVAVSMIDPATTDPTGAVFNTTTRNDLGEFEVKLPDTGAAEIQTNGFYFNEVLDQSSSAAITMRALAAFPASGAQSVHVNALTHLGYLRAKELVRSAKMDLEAAIAQAESELRAILPLARNTTISAGTELDVLGGDSDANAYLLALGCVLTQGAVNEATASVDATLQEQLNLVALDLEKDGTLEATLADKLARGARFLDAGECQANMERFVAGKGASATVPNIFRAVDFDRDGIADFVDPDADGDGREAASDSVVRAVSDFTGLNGLAVDEGGTVWTWTSGPGMGNPAGCNLISRCPPLPIPDLTGVREAVAGGVPETTFAVLLGDGRIAWWSSFLPTPSIVSNLDSVEALTSSKLRQGAPGGLLYAVRSDGSAWSIVNGQATQLTGLAQVRSIAESAVTGPPTLWAVHTDGTVTGHSGDLSRSYTVNGLPTIATIAVGDSIDIALAVESNGTLWRWSIITAVIDGSTTATQVNLPGPVVSASSTAQFVALADGSVWNMTKATPAQLIGIANVARVDEGLAILRDGTIATFTFTASDGVTVATKPMYIPR